MQTVNDRKEAEMTRTDLPQLRHPRVFSRLSPSLFYVNVICTKMQQKTSADLGSKMLRRKGTLRGSFIEARFSSSFEEISRWLSAC